MKIILLAVFIMLYGPFCPDINLINIDIKHTVKTGDKKDDLWGPTTNEDGVNIIQEIDEKK
jgi:hypothetical protein